MGERVFKYKQVIAVRTDLTMSRGKLAVQVAHGAVSAAELTRATDSEVWNAWFQEGQKKVVVKVQSEADLLDLRRLAVAHRIPNALIHDAGMTELPPGTMTVLGIGPSKSEIVDKVTGQLKLL
jgi:PTH2 family peptidyl-tRNA hydrolase